MGISVTQLLIVLGIVLVLFGTKRLRNVGSDLGAAIRGFRRAVKEEGTAPKQEQDKLEEGSGQTIDAEVSAKKNEKV